MHKQDSGSRKRERDSQQDACKALSQTAGDCLDFDEEEGEV